MFELKRVTVEILNDGSYDRMKHLTFPIRIENCIDYGIEVGMVDVPLDALIAAGYDKEKANVLIYLIAMKATHIFRSPMVNAGLLIEVIK
ncbi:hypothetical protein DEVORATOR_65 [Citrobacter phage_vB_CfrD_Devorator]|nr:hypothetical protein DEVORATOR_65 [Citrobacter phage_vB_CfrD_Devorator]